MSYCKREGKDKSVFVTSTDAEKPAVVKELVEDDSHGIILPNGEINWDCPCLGGMAYGTCGEQFKEAFSCFHYSEEEEKGIDCIPQFKNMQDCFFKYPEEYGKFTEDEDRRDDEEKSGSPEADSGVGTSESSESIPPPTDNTTTGSPSAPPTDTPATGSESGSKTGNELEPKSDSTPVQERTS